MSKGMQQRLGIAQALVGNPRLLLLDEPTSALDPAGRRVVRRLLAEVRSRGVAVLLSSHLLGEVELVCDRVAILVKGEIIERGTPAELARPRGVEVETDPACARTRAPGASRCRTSSPSWSPRVSGSTAVRVLASTLEDAYLEAVGEERADVSAMPAEHADAVRTVVGFAFAESLRRRVFAVVGGADPGLPRPLRPRRGLRLRSRSPIRASRAPSLVDEQTVVGSTLFGLAMFATLFLGAVLAIFLTIGIVRGDAESGLLQPLVVRPLGRGDDARRALGRRRDCDGGLRRSSSTRSRC